MVELYQWRRGVHLGFWEQAQGGPAQTFHHWGFSLLLLGCGEVVHIPTFSGVNILGWSHCCSCPLGSFLFHCNLFPQTQVACASGEYSILHIPNNQHFRKDSNNYYQVIGLTLSVSNLLGYLRCRLGRTESTSALISGVANQYLQVRRVLLLLTLKAGWTIALWELLNELFCRSKWWTGWWGSSVQLPEMERLELPWGSSACNTFNFQTVMWYLISYVTYLITSFTCWASFSTDGTTWWCDILHICHTNPHWIFILICATEMQWHLDNVTAPDPPCPDTMDLVQEQLQHGQLPKLLLTTCNEAGNKKRQPTRPEQAPSKLNDNPKLHVQFQNQCGRWKQECHFQLTSQQPSHQITRDQINAKWAHRLGHKDLRGWLAKSSEYLATSPQVQIFA